MSGNGTSIIFVVINSIVLGLFIEINNMNITKTVILDYQSN